MLIARANTLNRAALRTTLCTEADAWLAVCRRFPTEAGGKIAAQMGVAADRLVPHIECAMFSFLERCDEWKRFALGGKTPVTSAKSDLRLPGNVAYFHRHPFKPFEQNATAPRRCPSS